MNEIEKLENLIDTTEKVLHTLERDIRIGCGPRMYEVFSDVVKTLNELYTTLHNMN